MTETLPPCPDCTYADVREVWHAEPVEVLSIPCAKHDPLSGAAATEATPTYREPMKLYIAGPMTGLPEYNYPAFMDAERRLRARGYDVENPATGGQVDGWEWSDYMRRGISQLITCDGIALLDGWIGSRGARIEAQLAEHLGMRRRNVDAWTYHTNDQEHQ